MSLPTQRLPSWATFSSRVISPAAARPARRPDAPGPATGRPRAAASETSSRALLRHVPSAELFRNVAMTLEAMPFDAVLDDAMRLLSLIEHERSRLLTPRTESYVDEASSKVRSTRRSQAYVRRTGDHRCTSRRGGRGRSSTEISVDPMTLPGATSSPRRRRRRGAALAACGSSGPAAAPAAAAAAGAATYWFLTGQPQEGIRKTRVNRFNKANPNDQIKGTDVPERRLQDEDQDGHRRRPGARRSSGAGAAAA